jgi:hypothetical protein
MGLGMMRQFINDWKIAGGAKEFFVIFNDPNHCWDSNIEAEIRADPRFKTRCLTSSLPHSRLFRNIAIKHKLVGEQPVSGRLSISAKVNSVAKELIKQMVDEGVLDKSWQK